MPNWVWGTHAGGPTGGFGGAPYGAAKRCAGWVKRMEGGREGRRRRGGEDAKRRLFKTRT
eukprot:5212682-Pyramimonas_sp.AAC.1